ncbi:MAG: DUF2155 domain-containing protein [Deferrisomatales bacterium]
MNIRWLAAVGLAATVALAGCSKKEEPVAEAPKAEAPQAEAGSKGLEMPPSHPKVGGESASAGAEAAPPQRQIVVPDDVKNTWKAVVLELTDKTENKTEEVTVEIGQTVTVGGLEITVENFLPAFTMGGGQITSKSNETENPAARLIVKEGGSEVFSGWLFTLFPEAHPFQHERYGLLLKDFVKK